MQDDRSDPPIDPTERRAAPTITRLGTLAELTLGGTTGLDDGLGGAAGDQGSLG